MKKRMLMLLLICAVVISMIWTERAAPIPAFARRYKISCNTCHNPFPRLKDYGDEYAGDGFVIPEEEKARDYISAGDEYLWLNRDFPLAMKFELFSLIDPDEDISNDIQAPWGVKLLSGGPLFKNVSYYMYMYLSERGEVAGLEDAYLHFDNILGSGVDIMAGQFQTSDPLMKRELRLTFEDYQIYRAKVGLSNTNLTYDRGVMITYGIEQTSTDLVAMVVNGNGIDEAGEDRFFDSDKYKNVGLRLTQGIGKYLSVGGFYYLGRELGGCSDSTVCWDNEITYFGPDVGISIDRFSFTGQYMIREDTNPGMKKISGENYRTEGVVAELIFAPYYDRSRTYFTLLYNMIDSDIVLYDYETVTFSGTYLLARNLRLLGEYTRFVDEERNRVVLGVVSAF
ncbi:MAG: hypothetical protein GF417_07695 [Candidatus Latescibacteria bacterium]|nr:hypothetical protein [bacterium]MBD3424302.1 hypothetical protein [Candidatus Latescibacterota bacterium]